MTVFQRLLQAYGSQQWWPGDSPFEIMVGAVLTQNTNWRNVERALERLKQNGLLSPAAIQRTPSPDLEECVRPAGYYRVKARRLKNLAAYLVDNYDGSVEVMFSRDLTTLRTELLSLNGIGPETADSILLYAGQLPSFVVDTYTARILKRHGYLEWEADYYAIQDYCTSQLPDDTQLYNEFHALIVRVGKDHCRTRPRCEGCPLQAGLPADGPCEWN